MPSLIATLGANINPFITQLNTAKSFAGKVGGSIAGAFSSQLAGVLSVSGAVIGMQRAIQLGSSIKDLSLRLGMSTDAVQEWDYALKQNGSTMESAAGFFEKLARARAGVISGGGTSDQLIADFKTFGISMDQVISKTGKVENLARAIAAVYKAGGNQEKLIAPLMRLGGRGAADLVPTFVSGFDEMRAAVLKMAPDTIDQLDNMGDALDRLKLKVTSNFFAPMAVQLDKATTVLGSWAKTWWKSFTTGKPPDFTGDLMAAISAREANPKTGRTGKAGTVDEVVEKAVKAQRSQSTINDVGFRNQFASIGGFGHSLTSGPNVQLLDVQRKAEAHLAAMRQHTADTLKLLQQMPYKVIPRDPEF